MLRRLKADVAKGLPPKTETILMVGMSKMQKQLYRKLLLRDLDSITGKVSGKNRTAVLNIVMQLRKCCGHPYLFEGVEDRTLDPLGEHLIENCGKLSMVDKLLKRLKERGNRVLIFTQMTRVLDIIEDFMVMRGYKYYRIDGNTPHEDREASIDNFNAPGSEAFCFILSTRAGGLGINLQTADTCILYDSVCKLCQLCASGQHTPSKISCLSFSFFLPPLLFRIGIHSRIYKLKIDVIVWDRRSLSIFSGWFQRTQWRRKLLSVHSRSSN